MDPFPLDYLFKENPVILELLQTNPGLMKILWLVENCTSSSILTNTDTNFHEIIFENWDIELG